MSKTDRLHPLLTFVYFMSVIFITMFTMNPIIIILSFAGSICTCIVIEDLSKVLRSFAVSIPLIIIIAITNPLFVQKGVTQLFFIGDMVITLEAIIYGVVMATMLASIFYWFRAYNVIMTSDKAVYLFGKVAPKISLVLSTALRFVPLYARRFREADDASRALGAYTSRNLWHKIRAKLHTLSVVFVWSMENAIQSADSMSARGYGLKGRTHYHNFKWRMSDIITMVIVLCIIIAVVTLLALGGGEYNFYPILDNMVTDIATVLLCACYGVLAFGIVFIELKEGAQWHYLQSKI